MWLKARGLCCLGLHVAHGSLLLCFGASCGSWLVVVVRWCFMWLIARAGGALGLRVFHG